ncbi:MAG: glycosyltransferase family 2 protein [candidate division WOR-3 bacterium]|nr:glycosyltransferase family 2 protein [candidate division WOR-3 bacterium]
MKPFTLFVDSARILLFVFVQFLITITNLLLLRRRTEKNGRSSFPRVSVLIPARNEEATIGPCVASLLAQDYPDYEVLVLDDRSQDRTAEILQSFSSPRLRLTAGQPLPAGWTGKNWACHQLAGHATGALLLFTDADTVFAPDALSRAVALQQHYRLDLLTGIVHNQVRTFGEQLTVPFVIWSIITILPLLVAYRWRRSQAFAGASGKFLLFTRTAYWQLGGHQAVRGEAAEDLALARKVKRLGLNWRFADLTPLVTTRMYQGWQDAWHGFTKNFFALFDYRLLPAVFVWSWLLVITFHPLYTLTRAQFDFNFWCALLTVILQLACWLIISFRFRLPHHLLLLHPLIILNASLIGFASILLTIIGKNSWKGRNLPRHRIRIV